MPHLFVDISSHGFGHLAQTGPVLEALTARLPGLRLTIRSGLSANQLRLRISHDFDYIAGASDDAFLMHDAIRIDREATAVAYRATHADWSGGVAVEAGFLARLAPDLVLSNVSALPLAGARQTGVPSAALCSLNWADQFHHLFSDEPWVASIHRQLYEAYAGADAFLRCMPAMPMPDLPNCHEIPPIARCGTRQRNMLEHAIGARGERLVLVAMGGIGFDLPVACWPSVPGIRWLVPAVAGTQRDDALPYPELGFHFSDLLASVDAVVTKPGYGMFVESAAVGTPVLYLKREDWPEQEVLIDWLCREAVATEISAVDFSAGNVVDALQSVWEKPRKAVDANGAAVAAEVLEGLLRRGGRSA